MTPLSQWLQFATKNGLDISEEHLKNDFKIFVEQKSQANKENISKRKGKNASKTASKKKRGLGGVLKAKNEKVNQVKKEEIYENDDFEMDDAELAGITDNFVAPKRENSTEIQSVVLQPLFSSKINPIILKQNQDKKNLFLSREDSHKLIFREGTDELPNVKLNLNPPTDPTNFVCPVQAFNFSDKGMVQNINRMSKITASRVTNSNSSETVPVDSTFLNPSWVKGVILPDFEQGQDKNPGPSKLSLQNAILTSGKAYTKLDFSNCSDKEISIFPGMVADIYGRNPTGETLIVEELSWIKESEVETAHLSSKQAQSDFICLIASGPFTLEGDLDHIALQSLKKALTNVNFLILVGPFVSQKAIENNNYQNLTSIDLNANDIDLYENFISLVKKDLAPLVDNVILVNSYDDVNSLNITPQPSCNFEKISKKFSLIDETPGKSNPQIIFASEPAKLKILNKNIFISGSNILDKMLTKSNIEIANETCQKKHKKIERLTRHILKQENFAPCLNVPDLNVDPEQVNDYLSFKDIDPDLLVFTGNSKPFCFENFVNVGSCVQRGMAGYFVKILFEKEVEERYSALEVYKI